jgi:hypothetical protein
LIDAYPVKESTNQAILTMNPRTANREVYNFLFNTSGTLKLIVLLREYNPSRLGYFGFKSALAGLIILL